MLVYMASDKDDRLLFPQDEDDSVADQVSMTPPPVSMLECAVTVNNTYLHTARLRLGADNRMTRI